MVQSSVADVTFRECLKNFPGHKNVKICDKDHFSKIMKSQQSTLINATPAIMFFPNQSFSGEVKVCRGRYIAKTH